MSTATEAEPSAIDVDRVAADPLPQLEALRVSSQRWRGRALAAGAACLVLFVVAVVQFVGTFVTYALLWEARNELAKAQLEAKRTVTAIQHSQERIEQASEAAVHAERATTEFANKVEFQQGMKAEREAYMVQIKALRELQDAEEARLDALQHRVRGRVDEIIAERMKEEALRKDAEKE